MGITDREIESLKDKAKVLRRDVVTMLGKAGSGHPGGSLSAADIITALFFKLFDMRP